MDQQPGLSRTTQTDQNLGGRCHKKCLALQKMIENNAGDGKNINDASASVKKADY